jgi:uncharacterized delta-60 repeat protein
VYSKTTTARPACRRQLTALVVVLLLASVGCEGDGHDDGDDESTPTATPTQSASATPTVTPTPVFGDPSELDPSFGDGGRVTSTVASSAAAVTVQPDGRIVVAAGTLVLRYDAAGALDPSFGAGGVASLPAGVGAGSLALQSDGKIVAAGTADERFGVLRLASDGTLDATFGVGGVVATELVDPDPEFAGAHAVALLPDGRIVVGGSSGTMLVVARYDATGALDPSFGTAGIATLTDQRDTSALAVQADGKIVAAATSGFVVARFDADGTLDDGFGEGGLVTLSLGPLGGGIVNDLTLDGAGRIVAAGSVTVSLFPVGGSSNFHIVRLTPDGALDTTFGEDGVVFAGLGRFSGAGEVLVQPDGKIVAVGTGCNGSPFVGTTCVFATIRVMPDGASDPSFGTVTTTFPDAEDAQALVGALQPDGRIIAGGFTNQGGVRGLALARYFGGR